MNHDDDDDDGIDDVGDDAEHLIAASLSLN